MMFIRKNSRRHREKFTFFLSPPINFAMLPQGKVHALNRYNVNFTRIICYMLVGRRHVQEN